MILESLNRIANIHGRYSVDSKINLNFPKTFTRRLHQIVVFKVQQKLTIYIYYYNIIAIFFFVKNYHIMFVIMLIITLIMLAYASIYEITYAQNYASIFPTFYRSLDKLLVLRCWVRDRRTPA